MENLTNYVIEIDSLNYISIVHFREPVEGELSIKKDELQSIVMGVTQYVDGQLVTDEEQVSLINKQQQIELEQQELVIEKEELEAWFSYFDVQMIQSMWQEEYDQDKLASLKLEAKENAARIKEIAEILE